MEFSAGDRIEYIGDAESTIIDPLGARTGTVKCVGSELVGVQFDDGTFGILHINNVRRIEVDNNANATDKKEMV